MAKQKILDLIPESLREDLIQEVKELIEIEKKKMNSKPPSNEELDRLADKMLNT